VERSPPLISLYSYPDRQLVMSLSSAAPDADKDVAFGALAFSRQGSLLAATTGLPTFRLTVWDWRQRTTVASTGLDGLDCDALSFNPRSASMLCATGGDRAVVWRVDTLLDRPQMTATCAAAPRPIFRSHG
jgi:hypothetical protein